MTVDQLGRAVSLYRRTASTRSALVLLAANAIPLAGVLFFGWSLLTILVLYWLENGIVGFWNVPKILRAEGSALAPGALLGPNAAARLGAAGRIATAIYFCVHYGIFWLVHGVFVFLLPSFLGASAGELGGCGGPDPSGQLAACPGPFGDVIWANVAIAGVALFLSHGASFVFNYLGRGEFRTATPAGQMGSVYGRVVVLHVTIIFGAFAVAFLDAPIGALLLLVVLKTAFDLGLHLRERRAVAMRAA